MGLYEKVIAIRILSPYHFNYIPHNNLIGFGFSVFLLDDGPLI